MSVGHASGWSSGVWLLRVLLPGTGTSLLPSPGTGSRAVPFRGSLQGGQRDGVALEPAGLGF